MKHKRTTHFSHKAQYTTRTLLSQWPQRTLKIGRVTVGLSRSMCSSISSRSFVALYGNTRWPAAGRMAGDRSWWSERVTRSPVRAAAIVPNRESSSAGSHWNVHYVPQALFAHYTYGVGLANGGRRIFRDWVESELSQLKNRGWVESELSCLNSRMNQSRVGPKILSRAQPCYLTNINHLIVAVCVFSGGVLHPAVGTCGRRAVGRLALHHRRTALLGRRRRRALHHPVRQQAHRIRHRLRRQRTRLCTQVGDTTILRIICIC